MRWARHSFGKDWLGPCVAALWVLALAIQAFVVQTHIHIPWLEHGQTQLAAASRSSGGAHAPLHGDADHCRIWQNLLHAGAFTLPVADTPPRAVAAGAADLLGTALRLCVHALSHSWQGRAPPLS